MRKEELQNDKAVAEKDYKEAVGKLRYAINLHLSKTSASSPGKDKVLPQNGASSSDSDQNKAQQQGAGTSGGHPQLSTAGGLGAVGDAGACAPGIALPVDSEMVAAVNSLEGPPQANNNKENSEAQPQKASHAIQNFQLPQAALDMHRKIASATAHLLAQPLDEAPAGTEECPVCNEFMHNKCAPQCLMQFDLFQWHCPVACSAGGDAIRSVPLFVAKRCRTYSFIRDFVLSQVHAGRLWAPVVLPLPPQDEEDSSQT